MAGKPITMSRIKQIIRLRESGVSLQSIAQSLSTSRNTVKKYIRLLEAKGISPPEALSMDDEVLEKLFIGDPGENNDRYRTLEAFFPYMEKELKRTGVDRWLLWGEYRKEKPDGYSYAQFCLHYRNWSKQNTATMHFDHEPGDKLYIDYTGKHMQIIDRSTGEVKDVEVYVATLGYSQLTYMEATISQKKDDYINATQNALRFFGGVPKVLVPDNLKSAVTKASNYEAIINEDFLDFASHYEVTVMPARGYKPRDKALVEKAVSIVYKQVFAPLRNMEFYSIDELNHAIKQKLGILNSNLFQGKGYSRQQCFDEKEKSCLSPLPAAHYELKEHAQVTVMKNSHVRLAADMHYYSVPYAYIGKKVKISYTSRHISVYCNRQRIALHFRDTKRYAYTTKHEHMPSAHQFILEWNPDKFISWARSIDPVVESYIKKILNSKVYPEQAYRSCVGILSIAKKEGKERLINACKRADYYNSYGYNVIATIIKKQLDKMPLDTPYGPQQQVLPLHDNVRGKENYV